MRRQGRGWCFCSFFKLVAMSYVHLFILGLTLVFRLQAPLSLLQLFPATSNFCLPHLGACVASLCLLLHYYCTKVKTSIQDVGCVMYPMMCESCFVF